MASYHLKNRSSSPLHPLPTCWPPYRFTQTWIKIMKCLQISVTASKYTCSAHPGVIFVELMGNLPKGNGHQKNVSFVGARWWCFQPRRKSRNSQNWIVFSPTFGGPKFQKSVNFATKSRKWNPSFHIACQYAVRYDLTQSWMGWCPVKPFHVYEILTSTDPSAAPDLQDCLDDNFSMVLWR